MKVGRHPILEFRYRVIQLNRLDWRRFLRLKNPAATALMAKMKIRPEDRVRVKVQILRLLATLRLERDKLDLIGKSACSPRANRQAPRHPKSADLDSVVSSTSAWAFERITK